jgi:hypothetical protein
MHKTAKTESRSRATTNLLEKFLAPSRDHESESGCGVTGQPHNEGQVVDPELISRTEGSIQN